MAKSDGSTASYYELPADAKQLQHLIAYKNMNAQVGEIFRACYRYGQVDHSDKLRDINKILFYAQAEKERLLNYEIPWERKVPQKESDKAPSTQLQEFLDEGEEGSYSFTAAPMTAEEEEIQPKLPICNKCNREISGRVYYLGNEPRCKEHAN